MNLFVSIVFSAGRMKNYFVILLSFFELGGRSRTTTPYPAATAPLEQLLSSLSFVQATARSVVHQNSDYYWAHSHVSRFSFLSELIFRVSSGTKCPDDPTRVSRTYFVPYYHHRLRWVNRWVGREKGTCHRASVEKPDLVIVLRTIPKGSCAQLSKDWNV